MEDRLGYLLNFIKLKHDKKISFVFFFVFPVASLNVTSFEVFCYIVRGVLILELLNRKWRKAQFFTSVSKH